MQFLSRIAIFGFLMFSGSLAHAQFESRLPNWLRFDWTGHYPGASASQSVWGKVTESEQIPIDGRHFWLAGWTKPKGNGRPESWLSNPTKEIATIFSHQPEFGANSAKQLQAGMKRLGRSIASASRVALDSLRIKSELDPYWQYYQDCDRWGALFQDFNATLKVDQEITEIAFRRSVFEQIVSDFQVNFARRFCRLSSRMAEGIESATCRLVHTTGSTIDSLQYQEFLIVESPDYTWICLSVDSSQNPRNWLALEKQCLEFRDIFMAWVQPALSDLNCRTHSVWNGWRQHAIDLFPESTDRQTPFRFAGHSKRSAHLADSNRFEEHAESEKNELGKVRSENPEHEFDCELWDAYCE